MTESNEAPASVSTAFAFSRLLAQPDFRERLCQVGWRNDMDIIVTTDEETIHDLSLRIVTDATSPVCLCVWRSPAENFGFGLIFARPMSAQRERRKARHILWRGHEPIVLEPTTTVGMMYATLKDCADFFPSEWAKPVRFMANAAS